MAGHFRKFDLIAPFYSLFFHHQVRNFRRVIQNNSAYFMDGTYRILDIGCGTGALVSVLSDLGHHVEGVDESPVMIKIARYFNLNNQAMLRVGDALDLFDPADHLSDYVQNYDLVVASYVLHGLKKEQRMALYGVMKLLAVKRVVIMDYNQKRALPSTMIEWLEKGDYFNFIKTVEAELKASFPSVNIIMTGKRSAWYICECDRNP